MTPDARQPRAWWVPSAWHERMDKQRDEETRRKHNLARRMGRKPRRKP